MLPGATELYSAEMDAARRAAEDAFFAARPAADGHHSNREYFRAGFERAYRLRNPPADSDRPKGAGARFIPMRDVDALKAAGIVWPATYAAWQWLYRHREARGVAAAFTKIGRRVLVDPAKFAALMR